MRLLVTRPEPQASAWAEALRQLQIDAQPLPLIAITAPADTGPVESAWQHMADTRLLMFVSPAAAEWFCRLRPEQARWHAGTLAAAPGPGTARSLALAAGPFGLHAEQIISPDDTAEQFDSETLWPMLKDLPWQGQRVRIISGGDQQEAKGRTWLAEQWRALGAQVESVLSYQRSPGHWSEAQQALARAALLAPDQHVWLFSSSQAIEHLVQCHLPALGLPAAPDWAAVHTLVTHPKIAERARQAGISHIISARPTPEAVAQALRMPA